MPGDINLNPDIKNWVFRNGAAYELPLKMRIIFSTVQAKGFSTCTAGLGFRL